MKKAKDFLGCKQQTEKTGRCLRAKCGGTSSREVILSYILISKSASGARDPI